MKTRQYDHQQQACPECQGLKLEFVVVDLDSAEVFHGECKECGCTWFEPVEEDYDDGDWLDFMETNGV